MPAKNNGDSSLFWCRIRFEVSRRTARLFNPRPKPIQARSDSARNWGNDLPHRRSCDRLRLSRQLRPARRQANLAAAASLFICGHSHILKIMRDPAQGLRAFHALSPAPALCLFSTYRLAAHHSLAKELRSLRIPFFLPIQHLFRYVLLVQRLDSQGQVFVGNLQSHAVTLAASAY